MNKLLKDIEVVNYVKDSILSVNKDFDETFKSKSIVISKSDIEMLEEHFSEIHGGLSKFKNFVQYKDNPEYSKNSIKFHRDLEIYFNRVFSNNKTLKDLVSKEFLSNKDIEMISKINDYKSVDTAHKIRDFFKKTYDEWDKNFITNHSIISSGKTILNNSKLPGHEFKFIINKKLNNSINLLRILNDNEKLFKFSFSDLKYLDHVIHKKDLTLEPSFHNLDFTKNNEIKISFLKV